MTGTRQLSRRSAPVSMDCPWRSSSPRRNSASARCRSSSPISIDASMCLSAANGKPSPINSRLRPRSIGATSFSIQPRNACCDSFQSFLAAGAAEAAEQVAADVGGVRECMMALTEQSLIRRSVLPDDSSRWSMLESIRAFGRERLQEAGEAAPAQDRHADWCLAFAEEAGSHLDGGEQERWLARLDLEHDNARAALRWAADTSDAQAHAGTGDSAGSVLADSGISQRGAALARVGPPGCGSDLIDRVTGHGRGRRARADPGRSFSGAILVHPGAGRGKDH